MAARESYACSLCNFITVSYDQLLRHRSIHEQPGPSNRMDVVPLNEAGPSNAPIYDGIEDYTVQRIGDSRALIVDRIVPQGATTDYMLFLMDITDLASRIVEEQRTRFGPTKVHLRMTVEFLSVLNPEQLQEFVITEKATTVLESTNVRHTIRDIANRYERRIDEYVENKSGWNVQGLISCDVYVMRLQSARALSFFPLPKRLGAKHAIINVQNRDNKCFMWSVLVGIFLRRKPRGVEHMERVSHYKRLVNTLNFTGLTFPIALTDIPQFERLNNLRVIVYGYEEHLTILYIPENRTRPQDILPLLLVTKGNMRHYCFVRDLSKLLFSQSKFEGRKHICIFCLLPFTRDDLLQRHMSYCTSDAQQKLMPKPGNIIKFKNIKNQMWCPLVIAADIETFLRPEPTSDVPPDDTSYVRKTQLHVPNSFGYVSIRHCGCKEQTDYTGLVIRRCADPIPQFLEELYELAKRHQHDLDIDRTMEDFGPALWREFYGAPTCHICGEGFKQLCYRGCQCELCRGEARMRDHCHTCGDYRGAAHSKCNFLYKKQRDVTVILHNLRRYDGHLIAQHLGTFANRHKLTIDCVPKGMEDYLTFSLEAKHKLPKGNTVTWYLRFVDSFRFLPSSLASLVRVLANNVGLPNFRALSTFIPNRILANLLLRKGVYPYDMVKDWEVFDLGALPPPSAFFNKLTEEELSEDDYEHARLVWEAAGCTTFGDYHDLYLTSDVLQLADVYQNFRKTCMNNHGLDPVHYISLPSFAWDACLKLTKVELDMVSDPDMYEYLEAGIRGGVSTITQRYARANNPYMGEEYQSPEAGGPPHSYILYLDANNLYGWSMSQTLPTGDFQWVETDEIPKILSVVEALAPDAPSGYILEVDMMLPAELHDKFNDYPPAPERVSIPTNMLSPFSRSLLDEINGGPVRRPSEKLIPNLMPKSHYIVHYRNLQYYQKLGVVVTSVHRALSFKQSSWLERYVSENTKRRALAVTEDEKDFHKLMVNAVFGKSMENVRQYVDIRLVTTEEEIIKLVAKPTYKRCVYFQNDLVAIAMEPESVKLNKPIYTGFSILDLAKLLMYQFHYDYIQETYGERAKLLMTDTDSLVYELHTDDVYRDMMADLDRFDTSDYPSDHPLHSQRNKKVVGRMKDVLSGKQITEFVGLRAKMYSIMGVGEHEVVKRAKGVKKSTVARHIRHSDYREVLMNRLTMRHNLRRFQSTLHQVYTIEQRKISLSCFDEKRHVLPPGIYTLSHGHHRCSFN